MKRVIAILLIVALAFSGLGNVQTVYAAEVSDSHEVDSHEHDCSIHDGISDNIHIDGYVNHENTANFDANEYMNDAGDLAKQASINRLGLNIYDPFKPGDAPYDYRLVAKGNVCEYAPNITGYLYEKLEVVNEGELVYFDYDESKDDLADFIKAFAGAGLIIYSGGALSSIGIELSQEFLEAVAGAVFTSIIVNGFQEKQEIAYQARTYTLTYKVEVNGQSYTKVKRSETYWVVHNKANGNTAYEFMSSNASYDGTAEDFLAEAIGKYYTEHHNTNHVYTNDCDTTCDVCGQENRTISHTYSFVCDSSCNVCGEIDEERAVHTYTNDCDTDCNVCGEIREAYPHLYYCDCDITCNICGYIREDQATYEEEWQNVTLEDTCREYVGTCTKCGESKITTDSTHAWSNACDTECDDCGYNRGNQCNYKYVFEYANEPGVCRRQVLQCSKCGISEPTTYELSHVWNNSCEQYCIYCNYYRGKYCTYGSSYIYLYETEYCREIVQKCSRCGDLIRRSYRFPHTWSNACDRYCDECNYDRGDQCDFVSTSVKVKTSSTCRMDMERCSGCARIKVKYDYEHAWSNSCDRECNDCGYNRGDQCTYEVSSKTVGTSEVCKENVLICSGCGETAPLTADDEHAWSDSCDQYCNDCNYDRGDQCVYDSQWVSVATLEKCQEQVKTCTGCGKTAVSSTDTTHAWSGLCDQICNDCDYNRGNNCTYEYEWVKLATDANCRKKVQKCSVCGVIGTFTYDTTHAWSNACDRECNDCGYNRGDQCTYKTSSQDVATSGICQKYVLTCSGCGNSAFLSNDTTHAWSNSCDQYCNDCNYYRSSQCTYTYAWVDVTTSGTCQKYVRTCSSCGSSSVTSYDYAHAWSGSCDQICNDCDYNRGNNCTYTYAWEDVSTSANCQRYVKKCSVCGVIASISYDSAHAWSNSCDQYCNDCNYNRGEQCTYKLSSQNVATSATCQRHVLTCSGCGKSSVLTTDTAHAWSNSCDRTCNDCGYDRGSQCTYITKWEAVKTSTTCQRNMGTCSKCGGTFLYGYDTTHAWSNACDQNCDDCGYNRGSQCTYTTKWEPVKTSTVCQRNMGTCSKCGYIMLLRYDTAHTYSSTTDKTCNDCGYTRS